MFLNLVLSLMPSLSALDGLSRAARTLSQTQKHHQHCTHKHRRRIPDSNTPPPQHARIGKNETTPRWLKVTGRYFVQASLRLFISLLEACLSLLRYPTLNLARLFLLVWGMGEIYNPSLGRAGDVPDLRESVQVIS